MTLLQRLLALLVLALVAAPASAVSEDDLLPVDQAFVLTELGVPDLPASIPVPARPVHTYSIVKIKSVNWNRICFFEIYFYAF